MSNSQGQDLIDEPEYDPKFHVTAGELRASGIPVPEDLPDPAWTLRSSIKSSVKDVGATPEEKADGKMKATLCFEFAAPFRWAEITIPKDETKPCPDCNGSGDAPPKGPSLAGTTPAEIERIAFGAEPIADLVKSPCPTCDGLGFIPA